MNTLRTTDLTFGAIFVCLMAIGANIAVWFPFLAIPIGGAAIPLSLQTFFAIMAGMILGKKRGTIAMITYIFVGLAGIPVFAQMKAGPMPFASPTGGFIIAFIGVAFMTGWLLEDSQKPSMPRYVIASFAGLACQYIIGVTYMYLAMNIWLELNISYLAAWISMLPFLLKDAGLACLAGLFAISLVKRLPARWINHQTISRI